MTNFIQIQKTHSISSCCKLTFASLIAYCQNLYSADEHITSYITSKVWNADSLFVDRGGNIGNLTTNNGNVRSVEVNSGGNITNYTISGGVVQNITINSGGSLSLNHSGGTINTINLNGGSILYFDNMQNNNNQTINTMNINDGQIGLNFGYHLNGNINNLNINKWTIAISSGTTEWGNKRQHTYRNQGYTGMPRTPVEHLYLRSDANGSIKVSSIAKESIIIGVGISESGSGASDSDVYEYSKIIQGAAAGSITPTFEHLSPTPGIKLQDRGNGFSLQADVTSSYGITILKTMTLGYMRRNTMVQTVLDSVMKKKFPLHS